MPFSEYEFTVAVTSQYRQMFFVNQPSHSDTRVRTLEGGVSEYTMGGAPEFALILYTGS